jgi:Transglycosylase SLT domain
MTLPPGFAMYRAAIEAAATRYRLATNVLGALVWQESNFGIEPRSGIWTPMQFYRYEPGFWPRYLADDPAYQPPAGLEPTALARLAWQRRVSASYGLCHVMFATARDHGYDLALAPEGLLVPAVGLDWGARILRAFIDRTGGLAKALLRYNGGGRPDADQNGVDDYVDEVLDRIAQLTRLGI